MQGKDDNRTPNAKRINSDEQAYDDLLEFYSSYSQPSKKENTAERVFAQRQRVTAPKPKTEFKVDIKNIDSEIRTPKRNSVPTRSGTEVYTKPQVDKRPAHRYSDNKQDNGIDLMPAFEDDKRYIRKSAENIRPEYKNQPNERTSKAPKNSQKSFIEETKAALYSKLSNRKKAETPYKKPEYAQENGKTVIYKKSDLPTKKKIELFFKQNKKAWITLGICLAVAVLISTYAISCMNDILAIKRDSENFVTVNVPAQTDTSGAIDILKENKLIKHKYFCKVFAKFLDYRDDNYLSGIYYLTESMGLENMLSTFKKPMTTGETVTLTFPEGYTVNQIAEKLEKYEVCTQTAFFATVRDVDFSTEYSFISQMDEKDKRYQILEGYLYPDTYEFYVGENASSVIRKFLDNFKNKWTDEYAAQAEKLGMTVDDIVTLASIIEKEAYGADQMPLVSSVFHNRLKKSGIYPTLGSDATKEYVSEYISKSVTNSAELSIYQKNYDTYKCAGLPVGAICNPGNDAINAALNPASTGYYYFLHDNDKKIYLASTDAEHNANSLAALNANSKKSK